MHFLRSAMRVVKLVNLPSSAGYHVFMSIAKRIPDERSQKTVTDAFDVYVGQNLLKCSLVTFHQI